MNILAHSWTMMTLKQQNHYKVLGSCYGPSWPKLWVETGVGFQVGVSSWWQQGSIAAPEVAWLLCLLFHFHQPLNDPTIMVFPGVHDCNTKWWIGGLVCWLFVVLVVWVWGSAACLLDIVPHLPVVTDLASDVIVFAHPQWNFLSGPLLHPSPFCL